MTEILNVSDAVHSIKPLLILLRSYRDRSVFREMSNFYDRTFKVLWN